MKKRLFFILTFGLFLMSESIMAQDIKYFHAPGWYPFAMEDDATGKIYGASVDVLDKIAEKLGVKAEYVDVPWKRGFALLDAGDMDICAGAYDNAERRDKYVFSIPFMQNETRIFVRKVDTFVFNKLSDLKGKTLGKALGSSFGTEFDNFAKTNISITENSGGKELLFKMLQVNRVDGVLMDYYDAMYYLRNANLLFEIEPLKKAVNTVDVYLLVSKKSKYANKMNEINKIIKSMLDNGEMEKILLKY